MYQDVDRYSLLADYLLDLQIAMQDAQLWDCEAPTSAQRASQQPFCVDTMALEQWIRYVFIARCHKLIEQQRPLPTRCNIAPIAEQAFHATERSKVANITHTLDRIDQHLSS